MELAGHNRCSLTAALFVMGLLLNTTNPVHADTASADSDSSVPGIGRLFRDGHAVLDSHALRLSMSSVPPPRSIDETEDTYSLRTMIEWLRLRGYPRDGMDGNIRPHETDVVYTGFFIEMPDRRDAAWVEIYEYPKPTAALTFDACRSRFAMYVPDFPSTAARDSYIRQYCQVYRLHNLVMLYDEEMYLRGFDPDRRRAATIRGKEFINNYLRFSPENLNQLREQISNMEKALSLLEGERITDYEQACDLLSGGEVSGVQETDLFKRLQRARAKVGEYARWLEGRITEQMLTAAGPQDAPWLIANGYYQQAAAVGDATTLAALVTLADSAVAASSVSVGTANDAGTWFYRLVKESSLPDPAPPAATNDTGATVPIIRAAIDLFCRIAAPDSVPSPADASEIVRCLDEALTGSSGPLVRLWRDKYAGITRYRIGEIWVIGAYAGAIVAFPAGVYPAAGSSSTWSRRTAAGGSWPRGGWRFRSG